MGQVRGNVSRPGMTAQCVAGPVRFAYIVRSPGSLHLRSEQQEAIVWLRQSWSLSKQCLRTRPGAGPLGRGTDDATGRDGLAGCPRHSGLCMAVLGPVVGIQDCHSFANER
jgi:hypothetical protein